MSIVSISMLDARLPGNADSSDATSAVNRASSFVNTWAKDYLPFDDYQVSPETILSPAEIGEICLKASEAFYFLEIGQRNRDGNEDTGWYNFLYGNDEVEGLRQRLEKIRIEPTWESQTISLDSNNAMQLGSRNSTTGTFEKVIPYQANISGTSSALQRCDDFFIRKGGVYNDEYNDAWYLDVNRGVTTTNGTVHYLRTYRKDAKDYADYKGT